MAIILETASELGHKQGVAGRAGRQVVHQGLVLPILGRGLPNLNHVTHHELVIQLRHRVIEFDRGIICMCIHGPVAPPPQQILAGNGEVITARHVLRQLYIEGLRHVVNVGHLQVFVLKGEVINDSHLPQKGLGLSRGFWGDTQLATAGGVRRAQLRSHIHIHVPQMARGPVAARLWPQAPAHGAPPPALAACS